MAKALAEKVGVAEPLCTAALAQCGPDSDDGGNSASVFWDTFPSASAEQDPNVKVLHTKLVNKHVVLLLSQDDTTSSFAQLSLVLWLQRFVVPNPDEKYAQGKWKDTVPDGAFSVASVASLSVVIPWYRYCQMERTSYDLVPPRLMSAHVHVIRVLSSTRACVPRTAGGGREPPTTRSHGTTRPQPGSGSTCPRRRRTRRF